MPLIYSFPFKRFHDPGGVTFRPILQTRLNGPQGSATASMLLDSGADCSLVDRPIAEQLGLQLGKTARGRGPSGRFPVWHSQMLVEVRCGSQWLPPLEVPVDVPLRVAPPFPILGRAGVFEIYDILFQMGTPPERGMFHLVPHESPRLKKVFPRPSQPGARRRRAVGG